MRIKYNIPKINRLLKDLRTLTGISINFLDTEMNNIIDFQKLPVDYCTYIQNNNYNINCRETDIEILNKCRESQKLEMHICPAGLYDFAMPIVKNNVTAGYIIMGRIRSVCSPQNPNIADGDYAKDLYAKLPYYTNEQINSLKSLIPEILFQSAVEIETDSVIDDITAYISENLNKAVSIKEICKKFYVSKNMLYLDFKQHYNCTVNEYITNERIKKAKQLIEQTNRPLYEISMETGFDNYPYFCRLFKAKTGVSPSKYKKASENGECS